ncbi:MAG: M48 family metallopeptidase [Myxococcota bacterium]
MIVILVGLALWLVSKAAGWAVDAVPTSVDKMIGEAAASGFAEDSNLCDHPSMNEYVTELTGPILAAYGEQPYEFTFKVVDEEVPNAFALPGGFVTIHSGLIESAATGEEIAGVIAHEIAHVTHRHGVRRILRSAGIAIAVGLVFGSTDIAILADYAGELGALAYDRDQEREADETAREVLAAANIDPRGMASFFSKLLEEEGAAGWVPEFLSTHPDLKERIEESLEAALPAGPLVDLPDPEGLKCRSES